MNTRESCPFCGSLDTSVTAAVHDHLMRTTERTFDVRECRACGFAFLGISFADSDFGSFYPEAYFSQKRSAASRIFRAYFFGRQARMIARSAPEGSLLEIGCGRGDFLRILKGNTRLSLTGIEPATRACAEAAAIDGVSVFHGSLHDYPSLGPVFNVVVLRHVYEHLPDPHGAIRKIAGLLKPGGRLFLWLPFYGTFQQRFFGKYWAGFDAPRHLNYFSPAFLRSMLRSEGFKIRRTRYEAIPNLLALSARNYFNSHGLRLLGDLFDDSKSLTLLALTPLSLFLSFLGSSDNGMLEAEKI